MIKNVILYFFLMHYLAKKKKSHQDLRESNLQSIADIKISQL